MLLSIPNLADDNQNECNNNNNEETLILDKRDEVTLILPKRDEETKLNASSNEDQSDWEEKLQSIQDKGYAWAVCFASFTCFIIIDGMLFSFGVLYIELLDYFQESPSLTAWVGSAMMGTHMLVGPLSSFLMDNYGTRHVVCLGSLVAFIGFISSAFAPNIPCLIFFYGVVGGVGCGLIFTPAIAIIGFYFNKKRGIANGIANSGSGVGTFLYAPLTKFISDQYTWKGAMLILSSISLNMFVCGLCFRPIEQMMKSSPKLKKKFQDRRNNAKIEDISYVNDCKNVSDFYSQSTLAPYPKLDTQSKCFSQPNLLARLSLHRLSVNDQVKCQSFDNIKNGRKYILSGSLIDVVCSRTLHPGEHRSLNKTNARTIFKDLITKMRILRDPSYIIIVSMSILWTTHSTVLNYLANYAISISVGADAAGLLLSVIGISNIAGRIVAGYFADKPYCNVIVMNAIALFFGALLSLAFTFTKSYNILVAEVCAYGLCMGTWISLRPMILLEMIGLKKFTTSLGFLSTCQGISFLIGPPIAGVLFNYTDSYRAIYASTAAAFCLSSVLCIPLYRIYRSRLKL